jgi:uncharacterized OsmC-like protein
MPARFAGRRQEDEMQAVETKPNETKKKDRGPRNGVDTPTLFATLDAVKGQPAIAQFQFRVSSRWISGTNSRSRTETFTGAGGQHEHKRVYEYDVDHPAVLVGSDEGPTPVEFLLHGLAGCITAGIANIAAARGVTITEVTSKIEGDIDLNGTLGLRKDVRNGYQKVKATFSVKGDAPAETLREIVRQSQARSAVLDVLTNGVPVEIAVNAA